MLFLLWRLIVGPTPPAKELVGVYPNLRAVRQNTYIEHPDDGPIIGYEILWVKIYK